MGDLQESLDKPTLLEEVVEKAWGKWEHIIQIFENISYSNDSVKVLTQLREDLDARFSEILSDVDRAIELAKAEASPSG